MNKALNPIASAINDIKMRRQRLKMKNFIRIKNSVREKFNWEKPSNISHYPISRKARINESIRQFKNERWKTAGNITGRSIPIGLAVYWGSRKTGQYIQDNKNKKMNKLFNGVNDIIKMIGG